jgi:hypothetical protein
MHTIRNLIRQIDKTHKGLGAMVAVNVVAAKAKRCVLNVAPAGCGKSASTDTVAYLLKERCTRYTSLTLAGLVRIAAEMTGYSGHVVIDDLGAEKSIWSRTATISTLAHLIHMHFVHKVTQSAQIEITDFHGSAAINVQPVLMNSLVQDDDWVAVVRDKVLRYYHLVRPAKPKRSIPAVQLSWGTRLEDVAEPEYKGKLWYELVHLGLTQWSYARVNEHIPMMLKAMAAFDNRDHVNLEDYRLLIKMLKPMALERYLLESYGFEEGRTFNTNVYCILVELASWQTPSIETVAVDYKVHPRTVERLVATAPEWCWLKSNSPTRIMPTEQATNIINITGVHQKW